MWGLQVRLPFAPELVGGKWEQGRMLPKRGAGGGQDAGS